MAAAWAMVIVGSPILVFYTLGIFVRAKRGTMDQKLYNAFPIMIGLMAGAVISSALLVFWGIESMLSFLLSAALFWFLTMLIRQKMPKPNV